MTDTIAWPKTREQIVQEAVNRGVELLNELQPGWVESIDVEHLNLSSPCMCVLGQLYKFNSAGYDTSFGAGAEAVLGRGYSFEDATYYGFEYGDGYDFDNSRWDDSAWDEPSIWEYSYLDLESAWKRTIRRLKGI